MNVKQRARKQEQRQAHAARADLRHIGGPTADERRNERRDMRRARAQTNGEPAKPGRLRRRVARVLTSLDGRRTRPLGHHAPQRDRVKQPMPPRS